jgi:hypothetical protein
MPPGGHPATHAQAARTSRVFVPPPAREFVPPPAREKPDRLRCLAVAPSRETGSTDAPSPSPGTERSIQLFATPLQNQFAAWAFEYVAEGADRDPLAGNAKATLSRLTAPTTLMTFTAAEGAGGHQETPNRALAETRILDWLDDTLA